jgi:hypothetical protein
VDRLVHTVKKPLAMDEAISSISKPPINPYCLSYNLEGEAYRIVSPVDPP